MTDQIDQPQVRSQKMMRVANSLLYGEAWAIIPEKMDAIIAAINRIIMFDDSSRSPDVASSNPPSLTAPSKNGIGILNVSGVLSYRAGMFADSSGGQSIERTQSEFRKLQARDDVDVIVMNYDSPGGAVSGIQEFGDEIAASTKKVVAIANPTAASAAFWLYSAASEKYIIPSGQIGSVGVIAVHSDATEALAKEGIKQQIVYAGKYKAEGYQELNQEGLDHLQALVDSYYTDFINSLSKFSNQTAKYVESHFGQGRMVRAETAKENKMTNKIMTFDKLIANLSNRQDIKTKRKYLASNYSAVNNSGVKR